MRMEEPRVEGAASVEGRDAAAAAAITTIAVDWRMMIK